MNTKTWQETMTVDEIRQALTEDMQQLEAGSWEPDSDSISAHVSLIEQLAKRASSQARR